MRVWWLAAGEPQLNPASAAASASGRAHGEVPVGDNGRRAEIERLFARYHDPLLDYLFGMTHDRELAADLTQETFTRALVATQSLADVRYPQAWLYRIATNAALNVSRRQRRLRWLPLGRLEGASPRSADSSDRWPTPGQAPAHLYDDFAVDVAERDAVWRALIELPPRWRSVLLMQTTAGFSVREIADALRLEEGNVRKILFRAKERFRALYTQLSAQTGPQASIKSGGQG